MKNLDLNNYGVQEMNAEEMRKTDGGVLAIIVLVVGVVVGALIAHIVNESVE